LVGEDGEQLGIVPIRQALTLAEEAGLDLVEIAPMACAACLQDHGRRQVQVSGSQARSMRRKLKQKQVVVKEVKFRPGTDENDYQIKLRNVIKFLGEGDKAKITLRFRGVKWPTRKSACACWNVSKRILSSRQWLNSGRKWKAAS
jgi:translation initiation factor IF-3